MADNDDGNRVPPGNDLGGGTTHLPDNRTVADRSSDTQLIPNSAFGSDAATCVILREPEAADEFPVRLESSEIPPVGVGRYRFFGEIARGGMGAVLKGRDSDLGRDLAVKVLLETHRDKPDMLRRFVEEAQIGGQLQHPGIVPIYELGQFGDSRPYFTMRLVKGRTLLALLKDREEVADDRPRFLQVFEQICQTMAYAHARGVIHRDLKPANIMVGAFGEVQVMDWGLAKVLSERDDARQEEDDRASVVRVVPTALSGSDADASVDGSVLGTPAYMPPEQAQGDIDAVDSRADVFGLGAVLCEILTGSPPYTGRSGQEILRKAARGDLADATARLEGCRADRELIGLALSCLAPEPLDRPADAGAVAQRMSAYLSGVQGRLQAAEIAKAEAQARLVEERKRRKLSVALVASILGTVVVALGAWAWMERQRNARAAVTGRTVARAADEAVLLWGEARGSAVGDLAKWDAARASLAQAEAALAAGEAGPAALAQVAELRTQLDRESARARARADEAIADRTLIERLELVRSVESEGWDFRRTDAEYGDAFRASGIDPARFAEPDVRSRMARPAIASDVAAALDHWALARRRLAPNEPRKWRDLVAAARAADTDPWRDKLREAIDRKDMDALKALAADPDQAKQPAAGLVLLARALVEADEPDKAVAVLSAARRRFPDDLWVNLKLAYCFVHTNPPRMEEAIRYLTAAEGIHPKNLVAHVNLGALFTDSGRLDEAIEELSEAVRLGPKFVPTHALLAQAYLMKGRADEAVSELRIAKALPPDEAMLTDMINQLLPQAEQSAALSKRLVAVLDGKDRPKDMGEWLAFVRMAYDRHLHGGATKLAERGLASDPKLADVKISPMRYNAACCAALTADGKAEDDPKPDDRARLDLRTRAASWLRADLDAWSKILEANPKAKADIATTLQSWKKDADLASLRDAPALAKLPEPEKVLYQKLWADVEDLLKRCGVNP